MLLLIHLHFILLYRDKLFLTEHIIIILLKISGEIHGNNLKIVIATGFLSDSISSDNHYLVTDITTYYTASTVEASGMGLKLCIVHILV